MGEYRRGAHTVYEIHVHLVWTTKYRKQVLVGDAANRVRDLIREICGTHDVKIMKGRVSKDHVHLLISIPPQVTISRLVQWLKGKTAHKIMLEFPHIKKHYWGQHMWARGYFCCSTGNVTDEIIAEYIAHQQDDRDDDFKVDGQVRLLLEARLVREPFCRPWAGIGLSVRYRSHRLPGGGSFTYQS
jgi:putative transposase